MKFLKYLLYIVLAIAAIYLVMCAMGPKTMNTSESVVVNASAESVFEEISDFDRMNKWSPWVKMDPAIVHTNTGVTGTVGSMQSWKSKIMGDGSQAIVELRQNEYMKTELKFADWGDDISNGEFTLVPEGEGTKVTWGMTMKDLPFMARGAVMVKGGVKMMSETFKSGLADLKALVEAKPKAAPMAYEITSVNDTWYLGQNHTGLKIDAVDSSLFAKSYGAIGAAAGKNCSMTEHPFCIGRNVNYETGMMDIEMGMVTTAETKADGFVSGKIPAGRCVKHVLFGPYEKTGEAWMPLYAQIEKDGLKPRWDGYEVYANDPYVVKDPALFETWLMIPIE